MWRYHEYLQKDSIFYMWKIMSTYRRFLFFSFYVEISWVLREGFFSFMWRYYEYLQKIFFYVEISWVLTKDLFYIYLEISWEITEDFFSLYVDASWVLYVQWYLSSERSYKIYPMRGYVKFIQRRVLCF